MEIGSTLFTVLVIIIAVWLIIEVVKLRHKLIAVLIIGLLLFTYFSFTGVIDNNDVEINSFGDFFKAGKIYFNWLTTLFNNIKLITTHAISLDWLGNNSINKTELNSTIDSIKPKK